MSAAFPALGERSLLGIAALLAVAAVAGAGFFGYREQTQAWPPNAATTVAAAASAVPRSNASTAVSPASGARRGKAPPSLDVATLDKPAGSAALAWPLWEFQLKQPVPPRDPPLTPLPWRLIGATQSGGAWQIVVVRQGKAAPEFFKKGDSLPGGYRVDAITEEDVTLIKAGRPVILSYISSR